MNEDNSGAKDHKCRFCGRPFKTKSTLGRHLDQKSGDAQHPSEEVHEIREKVVRRGENRQEDAERAEERKAKRQRVSQAYNEKDAVKERNKERRRNRDQRINAQLRASQWYLTKLDKTNEPLDIDTKEELRFPLMVAKMLPPEQWPDNHRYPEQEHLNHLAGRSSDIDNTLLSNIFGDYEKWNVLSPEAKQSAWTQAVFDAIKSGLRDTSIREIENASSIVERKKEELLETKIDEAFLEF